MSTLHDLRSTLEQRADDLHDTDRYVRPVAVRARIRAVRRRRAAAASIAAALVLVTAVAAVGTLRSPGTPDPASVAGVDVPRSIAVLGFPYELSDLDELGDAPLHLDEADHERAATLVATGLGSGSATLYSGDQAVARVRGGEQAAAPVWIGDTPTHLRVELDGAPEGARTGVAVYEATGELAPGVANAERTSVFRNEVAGNPLVQAAFSEAGQHEVRLEAWGPGRDLSYVVYCAGNEDLWVNVDIDGDGPLASSCGSARRDAGTGTSGMVEGSAAARDHDVRVFLTRGADGPEVAPEGVEFGVGIYLRSSLDEEVAGQRIPARVEYGGRVWEIAGIDDAPATVDTATGDRLLGFAADGSDAGVTWHSAELGDQDGAVTLGDGGFTPTAGLLLAGDSYDVRVTGDVSVSGLVVYRPE